MQSLMQSKGTDILAKLKNGDLTMEQIMSLHEGILSARSTNRSKPVVQWLRKPVLRGELPARRRKRSSVSRSPRSRRLLYPKTKAFAPLLRPLLQSQENKNNSKTKYSHESMVASSSPSSLSSLIHESYTPKDTRNKKNTPSEGSHRATKDRDPVDDKVQDREGINEDKTASSIQSHFKYINSVSTLTHIRCLTTGQRNDVRRKQRRTRQLLTSISSKVANPEYRRRMHLELRGSDDPYVEFKQPLSSYAKRVHKEKLRARKVEVFQAIRSIMVTNRVDIHQSQSLSKEERWAQVVSLTSKVVQAWKTRRRDRVEREMKKRQQEAARRKKETEQFKLEQNHAARAYKKRIEEELRRRKEREMKHKRRQELERHKRRLQDRKYRLAKKRSEKERADYEARMAAIAERERKREEHKRLENDIKRRELERLAKEAAREEERQKQQELAAKERRERIRQANLKLKEKMREEEEMRQIYERTKLRMEQQEQRMQRELERQQAKEAAQQKDLMAQNAYEKRMKKNKIQPLFTAAFKGENHVLQQLVEDNCHSPEERVSYLNTVHPYNGKTALFAAIQTKRIDTVRLLLEMGASPDLGDSSGGSPLHFACQQKIRRIAHLLIAFGADIDARNANGELCWQTSPLSVNEQMEMEAWITQCVEKTNNPPKCVMELPDQVVVTDKMVEFNIDYNTFVDSDGDPLQYSVSKLPPGLSFNVGNMLISGIISSEKVPEPKIFLVTVSASDGYVSSSTSFEISVVLEGYHQLSKNPLASTESIEDSKDGDTSDLSRHEARLKARERRNQRRRTPRRGE